MSDVASRARAVEALVLELVDRVRTGLDPGDRLGPNLDPVDVMRRLSSLSQSAPVVEQVRVNGSRVDIVLVDDGDEWRVVLGTGDGRRVDWLSVYRRPESFAGVPGGRAVVVNGPSGAGKSTLLERLRDDVTRGPWVVFDEPEHVGSVREEFLVWPDRAPALHEGYLAAIGAMGRHGNLVAVAAGGRAKADFERHLTPTTTIWVGLTCDTGVLLARERNRTDRWGGLVDATIDANDGWDYDLTFDTSDSPDPAALASIVVDRCGLAADH